MGVSVRTARRAARDLDRRRSQFDRTMHRMVSADPHNYDMVLDTHSLGLDIVTEVIVRAIQAGLPGAMAAGNSPWNLTPGTQKSLGPQSAAAAAVPSRLSHPADHPRNHGDSPRRNRDRFNRSSGMNRGISTVPEQARNL